MAEPLYIGGGHIGEDEVGGSPAAASSDVFFENRHGIEHGLKPLTAAGMGGVLIE